MKITREELDEYARLDAEIKSLEKQARTLAVRRKQIESAALTQLLASGKTQCKRFGFSLALVKGRATVAWKDAFVRECGAERATELQAEALGSDKITITPPQAS